MVCQMSIVNYDLDFMSKNLPYLGFFHFHFVVVVVLFANLKNVSPPLPQEQHPFGGFQTLQLPQQRKIGVNNKMNIHDTCKSKLSDQTALEIHNKKKKTFILPKAFM